MLIKSLLIKNSTKNKHIKLMVSILVVFFTLNIPANAELTRIQNNNDGSQTLLGHVPLAVKNSSKVSHADSNQALDLRIILPSRNQPGLDNFIKDIYNPKSHNFHKFISSHEFAQKFGASQIDSALVISYLQSQGLTVKKNQSMNGLVLTVSGTVSKVESAFKVTINNYKKLDGTNFMAPENNPILSPQIAGKLTGIIGMDNAIKFQAHYHQEDLPAVIKAPVLCISPKSIKKSSLSFSGINGSIGPNDIKTAYNLNSIASNGSGQTLALYELDGYTANDITIFENYYALPNVSLSNVLTDGATGRPGGNTSEVVVDIDLAVTIAPGLSSIIVYEAPNTTAAWVDQWQKIADDNLAKVISDSWGVYEQGEGSYYILDGYDHTVFQQLAAQGQTVLAAAGDAGAYDNCDKGTLPPNCTINGVTASGVLSVDDPASDPYVTGVGISNLSFSNGSYISEIASIYGGGGVSTFWSIPIYQQGLTLAQNSSVSTTMRNVPDVSLTADPATPYGIFVTDPVNGANWYGYWGSSASTTIWAAFISLVNQGRESTGGKAIGWLNPSLYQIASTNSYATDFHDISSGSNSYYPAASGYDDATGLGSINGVDLYNDLLGAAAGMNTAQLAQYVLCVYNSHINATDTTSPYYTNPISKQICDYYVQKRPGAQELGIDIPTNAWLTAQDYQAYPANIWNYPDIVAPYAREDGTQVNLFERMTDANFIQYVSMPIMNYVQANPQIRYLAVAKDIPIVVQGVTGSNSYNASAGQIFLQFNVNAQTTFQDGLNSIGDAAIPINGGSDTTCLTNYLHFNPANCISNAGYLTYRFSVSYLDAFTLADVKELIDKAQAPAPNLNNVYWMFDDTATVDESNYISYDYYYVHSLLNENINLNNILLNLNTGGFGVGYPPINPGSVQPLNWNSIQIEGYGGWGTNKHEPGYLTCYTYTNQMPTANRAITDIYESWHAFSAAYPPPIRDYDQGLIFDAFTPQAFTGVPVPPTGDPSIIGGYCTYINGNSYTGVPYVNSMSGGIGAVREPTLAGVPSIGPYFAAYFSGKTLSEALQLLSLDRDQMLSLGDPIMTIADVDPSPFKKNLYVACTNNNDCLSGVCTSEIMGKKACAQYSNDCINGIIEVSNNTGECVTGIMASQLNASAANCVNGNWIFPACTVMCQMRNHLAACPLQYGDVNGDNKITSVDATLALYYAIERQTEPSQDFNNSETADVTSDGVTAWDAYEIASYANGNTSACPNCMTDVPIGN